jgi:hypothetical protein
MPDAPHSVLDGPCAYAPPTEADHQRPHAQTMARLLTIAWPGSRDTANGHG